MRTSSAGIYPPASIHWHLREGAADAAPILDRVFLAGHNLQCDLAVAGAGQCRDALLQLLLGRREGRAPDQFGGDEWPLLRLHEHQMAAVVVEIMGALRREFPRQLDIA